MVVQAVQLTHPFLLSPRSSEGENTQKGCPRIAGRLTVCQLDEASMIIHNAQSLKE